MDDVEKSKLNFYNLKKTLNKKNSLMRQFDKLLPIADVVIALLFAINLPM